MSEPWFVIAAVIVVVAVIVFLRSSRTKGGSMRDEQQDRARTSAEHVAQREDRRRAGMTAEDREWEEASLRRSREREAARETDSARV